jgi:hypothetical protein
VISRHFNQAGWVLGELCCIYCALCIFTVCAAREGGVGVGVDVGGDDVAVVSVLQVRCGGFMAQFAVVDWAFVSAVGSWCWMLFLHTTATLCFITPAIEVLLPVMCLLCLDPLFLILPNSNPFCLSLYLSLSLSPPHPRCCTPVFLIFAVHPVFPGHWLPEERVHKRIGEIGSARLLGHSPGSSGLC